MKAIECIKNLLAIVFILIAIILTIPVIFGLRPFIVMSGSMMPALQVGSLAYIDTKANADDIRVGDIIAYTHEGMTITHRVIDIDEGRLITKGDANNMIDQASGVNAGLIGKMRFSIPLIGYVAYYLQAPIRIIRRKLT